MRLGLIIVSITGTFFLIQFVYYARGHRGEDPPDPIPNSEVKLPIADDTACWWESRSLRAFFCPFHPLVIRADFFCSWKVFFPDSDFRWTRSEKICPSDARGLPTARPKPFFEKYVDRGVLNALAGRFFAFAGKFKIRVFLIPQLRCHNSNRLPISSARDSSGFFLLLEGVFPRFRFPLDAQGKNLPLRRARIAYSAFKTVF